MGQETGDKASRVMGDYPTLGWQHLVGKTARCRIFRVTECLSTIWKVALFIIRSGSR